MSGYDYHEKIKVYRLVNSHRFKVGGNGCSSRRSVLQDRYFGSDVFSTRNGSFPDLALPNSDVCGKLKTRTVGSNKFVIDVTLDKQMLQDIQKAPRATQKRLARKKLITDYWVSVRQT